VVRSGEVSLVLFDLGGVVCKFLPERRLRQLSSVSGKPAEQVRELLFESGFSRRCDRGDLSGPEMHQRACELLGWTADYSSFRRAWASAFEPDPSVLALVRALRRRCRTGLLTDNPLVIKEALGLELGEVGPEFDFLFFSSELRSLKPDPAIFRGALEGAVSRPEETLFIDDARANVDAARALGITSLLFSRAEVLEADLARERCLQCGPEESR
jgi:putative hydrolase of the HAD superfamily